MKLNCTNLIEPRAGTKRFKGDFAFEYIKFATYFNKLAYLTIYNAKRVTLKNGKKKKYFIPFREKR